MATKHINKNQGIFVKALLLVVRVYPNEGLSQWLQSVNHSVIIGLSPLLALLHWYSRSTAGRQVFFHKSSSTVNLTRWKPLSKQT